MRYPISRDNASLDESGKDSKGLDGEERLALDELYTAAFGELKRIAIASKRRRNNPAVSTGTLINAAWIRLATARQFAPESKPHFMNMAGAIMRQVLVETARRQGAMRRGRGIEFINLDTNVLAEVATDSDILALNSALEELAQVSPRQAQVVEAKFFGGCELSEIAHNLGVATATVTRDWRAARAWLASKLRLER